MTPDVNPPNNPIFGRINFTERQECPCARCSAHRKQWADYAESVAAPGNAQEAGAPMPSPWSLPNAFAGLTPEDARRDLKRARNVAPIMVRPIPTDMVDHFKKTWGEDGATLRGLPGAPIWIDDEEPAPGDWLDQDQAAGPISRPLRNLVWFLFGAALATLAAVVMEIVAEVVK